MQLLSLSPNAKWLATRASVSLSDLAALEHSKSSLLWCSIEKRLAPRLEWLTGVHKVPISTVGAHPELLLHCRDKEELDSALQGIADGCHERPKRKRETVSKSAMCKRVRLLRARERYGRAATASHVTI